MHRALTIYEVLGIIADCLAEDICFSDKEKKIRPSRQALAVLARTCRASSKPALNALWRKLNSLDPFISCIRNKVRYAYDDPLPPFNEEEWNVVLRYAPRVHELTLENDDTSGEILQSLCFRTTVLLPNLRKLRWVYDDHTALPSIRLLLSHSLVHLHVWLEDGDHTPILAFLECYHTFCPNLKSLHFRHSAPPPHGSRYGGRPYQIARKTAPPPVRLPQTAAISRAICRSPNVEILSCDSIDQAGLCHIARSRCLKKFSCNLLDYGPNALRELAGYGTPDRPSFENLRILDLRVGDLSSIIPFFKSQNQPFEEISLNVPMISTPGVLHEFFITLCSATRRRTLRRIKLQSTSRSRLEMSHHAVDFQVLSPLMTFNLHKLYINIMHPISLNDDEFIGLVQAWPELATLHFNHASGWSYPLSVQLPTLRGLVLLLAQCPKLHDLGLCLNAANIPSLSENESLIRNTAITRLSVSNSPIRESVEGVSRFLLEHLPSLSAVITCGYVGGRGTMDYDSAWQNVNKEIRQISGWRGYFESDDDSDELDSE